MSIGEDVRHNLRLSFKLLPSGIEYAEVELSADVTNWFCVYDYKIRNIQNPQLLKSGESDGYAVSIIDPRIHYHPKLYTALP